MALVLKRSIVLWVFTIIIGCTLTGGYGWPSQAAETLFQVTHASGCGYSTPQISADGQWLLAMTDCLDVIGKTGSRLVRVHRSRNQLDIVASSDANPRSATMSGDGRRVVFLSDADLVEGQNPDLIQQLFLYEGGTYRQLTHLRADMAGRSIISPQLSSSGNSIVFGSDADLILGENEDGNVELFLLEVDTGRLVQGTHTTAPTVQQFLMIDGQDHVVVFVGRHPVKKAATSWMERDGLYVWDRRSREVKLILESPVGTVAVFGPPVLAASGEMVIFHSQADFLGENPDRNEELFQVELATGAITQLTHTARCMNVYPSVSGDAAWVPFMSTCPYGADRSSREANIVALHLPGGEVLALTRTGSTTVGLHPPTIDVAGRVVAFSVNAELPAMVNNHPDLQIVTAYLPPHETRTVSPKRRLLEPTDVTAWLVSKQDPKSLYLGTRASGVLRSRDEGRTWQLASYRLGDAHITGLIEGSRPNLLYAGTAKAGMYRSIDGGQRWLPINDGLADFRITALAIDPEDPLTLTAQTPTGTFTAKMFEEEWQLRSSTKVLGNDGSLFLTRDSESGGAKGNVQSSKLNDGSAATLHDALSSLPGPILLPSAEAVESVLQIPKTLE